MKYLKIIFAILLLSTALFAQEEIPVKITRISDKVLVLRVGETDAGCNIVALAGKKGLVVIDTGNLPSQAVKNKKLIAEEFKRDDFAYVINTHYHFDHTNGNQAFADSVIIGHEKSRAGMFRFRDGLDDFISHRRKFKNRLENELKTLDPDSQKARSNRDLIFFASRMIEELQGSYRMTPPELTFKDRLTLDIGGLTLILIYFGQGMHTGDDILICIPEEKLLVSGDLFFKDWLIALRDSSAEVENWLDAFSFVTGLDGGPDLVIPGHGEFLTGQDIQEHYDYLNTMCNEVSSAFKKGNSLEETQKNWKFTKMFPHLGHIRYRYNEQNFHQINIEFMWEKLQKTAHSMLK